MKKNIFIFFLSSLFFASLASGSETTSSVNYKIAKNSTSVTISTASSSAMISNTIDYWCWND